MFSYRCSQQPQDTLSNIHRISALVKAKRLPKK